MIEEKVAGQEVVATPEPYIAPAVDIMEALKKSLAQTRKPPKPAEEIARKTQVEAPVSKKRPRQAGPFMSFWIFTAAPFPAESLTAREIYSRRMKDRGAGSGGTAECPCAGETPWLAQKN
jgi:hypothetical protein